MRARSLLAVALIALPAAADAQRFPMPRIRDRGPAQPVPLPPTAGPIAYERQYMRRPFTVESYPLVSYFSAPGFSGDMQQFINGGMGERLDFRLNGNLSFTLDLTQSFIGGPAVTQTAELGVRVRPESQVVRKWYPYLDVRGGYVYVAERSLRPYDYVSPTGATYYQAAGGVGGIVASGIEYALHPRATITTGASLLRANLAPFTDGSHRLDRSTVTAVRYTIGVRFNPGYWAPANSTQTAR